MDATVLVLDSPDKEGYIELTPTAQGRLLRKKILPMNAKFIHPADHKTAIFIDKSIAASLVKNFKDKMVEHVQLPVVDDQNRHSESPLNNLGEVLDLDYDENGVYATIDARKHAEDFGKTILNSSAFMHMNYVDTSTGKRVGPTLLHLGVTNRGHVRNMGTYEDILKASADNLYDDEKIVFLSTEETIDDSKESVITMSMTKDEMLAELTEDDLLGALKDKHGTDVAQLKSDAAKAAELSAQFESAKEELKLSADTQMEDLTKAALALSDANKDLGERVASLEAANSTYVKREAEHEVDDLVKTGRVLPAARDAMVKLSLNDRETFDALVPAEAIVQLSESGVTVHEQRADDTNKIAEYADRFKNLHKK